MWSTLHSRFYCIRSKSVNFHKRIGEIEYRWTLKVRWTHGGLWPLLILIWLLLLFLIRVMLLVWERSSHAKKVDASLNDSCRCITGCLRPTNVDSLYVLAGIAPPGVRRSVASRTERRRQADDTRHPCHNHQPAPSRLKSRKSFLHEVQPLSQPPQTARLTLWEEQRSAKQHLAKLPIPTSEQLAPGHKSEWKLWKSLTYRLRTGMGRSKTNMSKWGYADTADTACECGTSEQTMQHLLRCPLLENECSLEDLATANEKALHCARAWPNIWLNSEMMDTKEVHSNTSCRYKRVEPRHIRLTKIVIFDDNLCKITPKLAVILFWPFQLIVYSVPSNWFGHFN